MASRITRARTAVVSRFQSATPAQKKVFTGIAAGLLIALLALIFWPKKKVETTTVVESRKETTTKTTPTPLAHTLGAPTVIRPPVATTADPQPTSAPAPQNSATVPPTAPAGPTGPTGAQPAPAVQAPAAPTTDKATSVPPAPAPVQPAAPAAAPATDQSAIMAMLTKLTDAVGAIVKRLDGHDTTLGEHGKTLDSHGKAIKDHEQRLQALEVCNADCLKKAAAKKTTAGKTQPKPVAKPVAQTPPAVAQTTPAAPPEEEERARIKFSDEEPVVGIRHEAWKSRQAFAPPPPSPPTLIPCGKPRPCR